MNISKKFFSLSILSVFLLFSSCKEEKIEPPIVMVEPSAVDDIKIYGEYVGLIRATSDVEIHSRVEGYLQRITFSEGKKVSAGEPLFHIDNTLYEARLDKAKAQLKKDEAQFNKTQRDLERIRPLYEQNAASRLDLDNAIAAHNIGEANVNMSRAELKQATVEYNYTIVRSPISGYISERFADVGSYVGKSGSSLLARVVKRDTVSVDFKLTALDYLKSQRRNVHLGEQDSTRSWQPTVKVTLADNTIYPEEGAVDFASPQVDPKTGTFGVRAAIANPNQVLLPGQFTRVKLLLDVKEDVVVAPRKAVIIEKGGAFIYIIRPDSIAEKRFIEIGPEQDNMITVSRGLAVNENIVIEGYQKLVHGQKAIPRTFAEEQKRQEEEKSEIAHKAEEK